MVLVRCSGCEQRSQPKYTSVTWAWVRSDGVRVAYRGRLCNACFMAKVSPIALEYSGDMALTCPQCGIDTEGDMDAVWTTSYLPGYGELKGEAPFCGACAAMYRVWVLDHSWSLESNVGPAAGPTTHASGDEVLRAMGIVPRVR